MVDDDRLRSLVRSALPRTSGGEPPRDLWPLVITRLQTPNGGSWWDVALAATTGALLLLLPDALFLIAYHL